MIIPTGKTDTRMTHGEAADRRRLHVLLAVRRARSKAGPTATARCRSTWCRPASSRLAKLKAADPKVELTNRDVRSCNNPTFDGKNLEQEPAGREGPAARGLRQGRRRDRAAPSTGTGWAQAPTTQAADGATAAAWRRGRRRPPRRGCTGRTAPPRPAPAVPTAHPATRTPAAATARARRPRRTRRSSPAPTEAGRRPARPTTRPSGGSPSSGCWSRSCVLPGVYGAPLRRRSTPRAGARSMSARLRRTAWWSSSAPSWSWLVAALRRRRALTLRRTCATGRRAAVHPAAPPSRSVAGRRRTPAFTRDQATPGAGLRQRRRRARGPTIPNNVTVTVDHTRNLRGRRAGQDLLVGRPAERRSRQQPVRRATG